MFFKRKAEERKMSVLRKAVYATGPVIRVLLGASALLLVVIGMKNKSVKRLGGGIGSEETVPEDKSTTR
jgi:hypothetical protein